MTKNRESRVLAASDVLLRAALREDGTAVAARLEPFPGVGEDLVEYDEAGPCDVVDAVVEDVVERDGADEEREEREPARRDEVVW